MINIKNLNFSYGENFKLNIEKLNINPSEFVSIIGPNGAGKSTLIKILSGIIKDYSGEIILNNSDLKNFSHKNLAKLIAVVPQEFNTIFDFDIESIISTARIPFSSRFSISESKEDKEIINNSIEQTDLNMYRGKKFSRLSGGEKQRVMIARAFAQLTDILLLDEFSSHLDPGHSQILLNLIHTFAKNKNKTVISIFHDINMACLYSDRIIIMNHGFIMYDGKPAEVINKKIIKEIFNLNAHVIAHPTKKIPQIIFE
jgi:iron complex transport system ATP-binding protein